MNYILLPFLLLLSATMSGLTLAFLGLDTFDLKRKAKIGDKNAARILPIRQYGNWALCTFLITNAAVNSTISMLLGESVGTGLLALAIATASIFIFGEVIPQAVCNKYKLPIASATAPLIKILMWITSPVTYPMSRLLDKFLGNELPDNYSQKELQEIINDTPEHYLDQDEKKILAGGLSFSSVSAIKIMTPVNQVFALEKNTVVTIAEIKEQTYSRIPVYEGTRDNIVGVLYSKDLLGVNSESFNVKDYFVENNLIKIDEKTLLDDLLNKMTVKKSHMSFIYDEYGVLRGIVTLEDIVETIINREIVDEHDQIADLQDYAKKEFNLDKIIEETDQLGVDPDKLPWGTYGKDHNEPLSWVRLSDCSTEHLKAIKETQPQIANTKYETAINYILIKRSNAPGVQDMFSEANGYKTPTGFKEIEVFFSNLK